MNEFLAIVATQDFSQGGQWLSNSSASQPLGRIPLTALTPPHFRNTFFMVQSL